MFTTAQKSIKQRRRWSSLLATRALRRWNKTPARDSRERGGGISRREQLQRRRRGVTIITIMLVQDT